MTNTRLCGLSRIHRSAGFTLTEVLISIGILIVIGALCVSAFLNARTSKNLDVITDGLNAVLEQAKGDAIAGKNASMTGVRFDTTSYTYFSGSTYTAGAAANKVTNLPSGWRLSTSTSFGQTYVYFNRLTGSVNATGTITISKISNNSTSTTRYITVGSAGDISVIR